MYKLNNKTEIFKYYIRGVFLSNKFLKKKKKQVLVYLRSPKHFNIGKHKIYSFNNYNKIFILPSKNINLQVFVNNQRYIFNFLLKKYKLYFPYKITSIRITIKSKIKFKWLVGLFFM